MSEDIREVLAEAAGPPPNRVDVDRLVERGRRWQRRRRLAGVAAGLLVLTVLGIGVFVASGWLQDPDAEPAPVIVPPTSQPTAEPSQKEAARDSFGAVIATNGTELFYFTDDTSLREAGTRTHNMEAGRRVVSLAVRPGSSLEDLTALVLVRSADSYRLEVLRSDGDTTQVQPLPARFNVEDRQVAGPVPHPVWSPDGRYFAWVENSDQGPVLHVVTWAGDSDSMRPTEHTILDLGLNDMRFGPGASLQRWTWRTQTDSRADRQPDRTGFATGTVEVTDPTVGGGSGVSIWPWEIRRRSDGSLSVADGPFTEPDHGPAFIDVAGLGDSTEPRYLLRTGYRQGDNCDFAQDDAADSPQTSAERCLTPLRWSIGAQGGWMPVPAELDLTRDASTVWMTAHGNTVLIGAHGNAWMISRDGYIQQLAETVTYADFVR